MAVKMLVAADAVVRAFSAQDYSSVSPALKVALVDLTWCSVEIAGSNLPRNPSAPPSPHSHADPLSTEPPPSYL